MNELYLIYRHFFFIDTDFPGVFALETNNAYSINELLSKTVKDSLKGNIVAPLEYSVDTGECLYNKKQVHVYLPPRMQLIAIHFYACLSNHNSVVLK
jgi:hypothetical protein